jgi:hypothetical protein
MNAIVIADYKSTDPQKTNERELRALVFCSSITVTLKLKTTNSNTKQLN